MKNNKKYFFTCICILFMTNPLASQNKFEFGACGGISYYLGNFNPSRQFYSPSLAYGFTLGYILDPREALRFVINKGQLTGSGIDFNNANLPVSFSTNLIDINAVYEFNYLPYKYKERHIVFSPFLFVGLGYEVIVQSTNNIPNHIVVPFGMGIKYLLTKKITVGLQWSFRKTFQDQIDGVGIPGGNTYKSFLNNNDWYSFAGFFISFRLFDNSNCAVYQ